MSNKLTNAEIKKALEQKIEYCREFDENNEAVVKVSLLENALGLINRYEAEVERLKEEIEFCPYCHEDNEGYVKMFGRFYLRKDHFNGWNLYAGKGKPLPIKYCPMCGRPLVGDNNE